MKSNVEAEPVATTALTLFVTVHEGVLAVALIEYLPDSPNATDVGPKTANVAALSATNVWIADTLDIPKVESATERWRTKYLP